VDVFGIIGFFVTLVFVIWQPRGLQIATTAIIGTLLALAVGVVKATTKACAGDECATLNSNKQCCFKEIKQLIEINRKE